MQPCLTAAYIFLKDSLSLVGEGLHLFIIVMNLSLLIHIYVVIRMKGFTSKTVKKGLKYYNTLCLTTRWQY